MYNNKSSVDAWGSYYKPPKVRRANRVPQVKREELNEAIERYLQEGGTIEKLEAAADPGKLAQTKHAYEFTECPDVF